LLGRIGEFSSNAAKIRDAGHVWIYGWFDHSQSEKMKVMGAIDRNDLFSGMPCPEDLQYPFQRWFPAASLTAIGNSPRSRTFRFANPLRPQNRSDSIDSFFFSLFFSCV